MSATEPNGSSQPSATAEYLAGRPGSNNSEQEQNMQVDEAVIKALDEARLCLNAAARLSLNINNAEAWSERFREAEQGIEAVFYAGKEGVWDQVNRPGWYVAIHDGKVVGEANDLVAANHIYAQALPDPMATT